MPSTLQLDYLCDAQIGALLDRSSDHLLGAIEFGAAGSGMPVSDMPWTRVRMPVLGASSFVEVWSSDHPTTRFHDFDITGACTANLLFGVVEVPQGGSLGAATYGVYERIFDCVDQHGFPNLLRLWNYFPGINLPEDGLERYRRFSVGRHEAFLAHGRTIGRETAAACALGTEEGDLVVYFLAARAPGEALENPRQISAYAYPAQYGPRSPTFSRAMLAGSGGERTLFISGTASIVGHETVHAGDAAKQLEETLANIDALSEQAARHGMPQSGPARHLFLKAYLRHAEHFPAVQARLRQAFGPHARIVCLRADICRADLLLEIEGVALASGR